MWGKRGKPNLEECPCMKKSMISIIKVIHKWKFKAFNPFPKKQENYYDKCLKNPKAKYEKLDMVNGDLEKGSPLLQQQEN